jgi:hypothetical protein
MHQLYLSYEASSFDYREPGVMHEEGALEGYVIGFAWSPAGAPHSRSRMMLRLEYARRAGTVDYDGQLSDGTAYRIAGIDDQLTEARVLLGIVRRIDAPLWMIAFTGYGWRELSDDASFDPAGYERISRYAYLPLGIGLVYPLGAGSRMGAELEYDLLLRGKQISRLSERSPEPTDIENVQRSGSGARGSLWLQVGAQGVSLRLGPWVRHWSLDTSEPAESSGPLSSRVEPRNHSWEIGVHIGLVLSLY